MITDEKNITRITVKKADLIEAMKKNRATHEKEYLEAREGYKITLITRLEEALAYTKKNGHLRGSGVTISMAEPESHLADYDRVLAMLEMSTATEVTITENQFSQYVMDEWSWSSHSKAVNSAYYAGRAG